MNQDTGVTKGAKGATSTLGNAVRFRLSETSRRHTNARQVGGLTNTVGGTVGGATRGVGETVSGTTGSAGKPVGDGVADAGTTVERGVGDVSQKAKDAGEWKK
jgi:hypothetical protein